MIGWSVLSLAGSSFAQNTSRIGRFSANKVIGCAPLTINITELDDFGNISRQYQYEQGLAVTNTPAHTFNTPGVYDIVQIVQNEIPRTDTLTIIVNSPDIPQVTVANCRNFSASVKAPEAAYDYYRVYYTATDSTDVVAGAYATPYDFGVAGSFQVRVKGFYDGGNDSCGEATVTINTLLELTDPTLNSIQTFDDNSMLLSASFSTGISYILEMSADNGVSYSEIPLTFQGTQLLVDQLTPQVNNYCFRLAAYDPCNDEFYYSNTLCHASLSVSFEQYRNLLNWNTPGLGSSSYEIIRNDISYQQSSSVQSTQYADSTLVCNTDYCYQLRVNYPGGFALSQVVCGTSFEVQNLSPVTGMYATYQNDGLFLRWSGGERPASPVFQVAYSSNGQNFSEGNTFSSDVDEQLLSDSRFLQNSYLYSIQYADECGNISPPGAVVRPVFLEAAQIESNLWELSWNQYEPLTDGVRQYFAELWDADMALLATFEVWDPTFYELRLTSELSNAAWVTVRAEGFGADSGFESTSNRRPLAFQSDLYVPSAFTPNGDGLNEELGVIGPEVSGFSFRIFNRWGELVFSTTEQPRGWNGVYRGTRAPQGTYIYFIEATDTEGRQIKKSGNFVLLTN